MPDADVLKIFYFRTACQALWSRWSPAVGLCSRQYFSSARHQTETKRFALKFEEVTESNKLLTLLKKPKKGFLVEFFRSCGCVVNFSRPFQPNQPASLSLWFYSAECPVVYQSYPRGVDSVEWALQYKVVLLINL